MGNQDDDKYYNTKRVLAMIIAPFYLLLIAPVLMKIFDFGPLERAKKHLFSIDIQYHPTIVIEILSFATFGFIAIIAMSGWLNRQDKLPLPPLTFLKNPLHLKSYAARQDLIAENLETAKHLALLMNNSSKLEILNKKAAITILNTNRLLQSFANMLNSGQFQFEPFLCEIANEICTSVLDSDSDKSCSIMFVDFESDELVIVGHSRIRPQSRTETRFKKGEGFAGSIWKTGRPDICNNAPDDPRFRPWSENKLYRSAIGIPIYYTGTIMGVICVQDSKEDAFCPEDIPLISSYLELINLFMVLYTNTDFVAGGGTGLEEAAPTTEH